jgi:hypothetical protein
LLVIIDEECERINRLIEGEAKMLKGHRSVFTFRLRIDLESKERTTRNPGVMAMIRCLSPFQRARQIDNAGLAHP